MPIYVYMCCELALYNIQYSYLSFIIYIDTIRYILLKRYLTSFNYVSAFLQVRVKARDTPAEGSCDSENEARITVNVYRNEHAPEFINEPYAIQLGMYTY